MPPLRYNLIPFDQPMRPGLHCFGHPPRRIGWYITLSCPEGATGTGEVAPLPGFSRETLQDATGQLHNLLPVLLAHPLTSWPDLNTALDRVSPAPVFPSVRFGLESAWLNLLAAQSGQSIAALLGRMAATPPGPNALLTGSAADIRREAEARIADGYTAFKLKVGHCEIQEDIERVQALVQYLPDTMQLRLDANRKWDLTPACEFGRQIPAHRIAYIEEPVKNVHDCTRFFEATHIPVALDESMTDYPLDQVLALPAVQTLVFKPMLRDGIAAAFVLADRAVSAGKTCTLTASFESRVGLDFLHQLAALAPFHAEPAGLDTWRYFDA